MNNKFKAQTSTGNRTGNSRYHVLVSHALNISSSSGQSVCSIESSCMIIPYSLKLRSINKICSFYGSVKIVTDNHNMIKHVWFSAETKKIKVIGLNIMKINLDIDCHLSIHIEICLYKIIVQLTMQKFYNSSNDLRPFSKIFIHLIYCFFILIVMIYEFDITMTS